MLSLAHIFVFNPRWNAKEESIDLVVDWIERVLESWFVQHEHGTSMERKKNVEARSKDAILQEGIEHLSRLVSSMTSTGDVGKDGALWKIVHDSYVRSIRWKKASTESFQSMRRFQESETSRIKDTGKSRRSRRRKEAKMQSLHRRRECWNRSSLQGKKSDRKRKRRVPT